MMRKCLGQLMVQMALLIILMVLAVQASDLNHPSLCTSSRSVRLLLHSSQPFISHAKESLYDCLEIRIQDCKATLSHERLTFTECITHHFYECLHHHTTEIDSEVHLLSSKVW